MREGIQCNPVRAGYRATSQTLAVSPHGLAVFLSSRICATISTSSLSCSTSIKCGASDGVVLTAISKFDLSVFRRRSIDVISDPSRPVRMSLPLVALAYCPLSPALIDGPANPRNRNIGSACHRRNGLRSFRFAGPLHVLSGGLALGYSSAACPRRRKRSSCLQSMDCTIS